MFNNWKALKAVYGLQQFETPFNVCCSCDHSHKKPKESLEARTEQAVLRAYVENQVILVPIFSTVPQKNPKKAGLIRLFVNSHFTFLCD